jgi:hypothetical protein
MPKTKPHTITVGTQKVVVYLADVYANIGSVIGVDKLADNADIDFDAEIGDLIKRGQAVRVRVGYGAEGAPRLKYAYVVCDIDNAKNIGKMIGKTFKGAQVQTVGFRRRRRLG